MAQDLPQMPLATAVWLVDNTTLTFRQIADFVGMHELEISGIADEEVAIGIKGADPIVRHQLTAEEIKRCEDDPIARLKLVKRELAPEPKKKTPRYWMQSTRPRPRPQQSMRNWIAQSTNSSTLAILPPIPGDGSNYAAR